VNSIVARPRPDVPRLNATPVTSSFPSGHVAATVVVWTAIAIVVAVLTTNVVLRVLAWLPVAILPALVGFARVYRGMHFLTDVIAGAVLGLLALAVTLCAARVFTVAERRRAAAGHGAPTPDIGRRPEPASTTAAAAR
jgi:undecaprenyl-diphosphatase